MLVLRNHYLHTYTHAHTHTYKEPGLLKLTDGVCVCQLLCMENYNHPKDWCGLHNEGWPHSGNQAVVFSSVNYLIHIE